MVKKSKILTAKTKGHRLGSVLVRYKTNKDGKAVKEALVYTAEEHGIKRREIDKDALAIVSRLKDAGYTAYVVGGAVRDLIAGKTPKDIDIVTSAEPQKIRRLFRRARVIGHRFRLVHVIVGKKIFEVSTFRSSSNSSKNENVYGSMEEDASRRDFSLNALYYETESEEVIDYVGGFEDIKNKTMREIIPLPIIFSEDPVRMLRAVKYSLKIEALLPANIKKQIKKDAHLLSSVSPSRLTEEMLKILRSKNCEKILSLCMELSLFSALQEGAFLLMKKDETFKAKYTESLKKLSALNGKKEEMRTGKLLYFIIRDYALSVNLEAETGEAAKYKEMRFLCRTFIRPINPPRIELDYALRLLIKERKNGGRLLD